jgi:hypothetical protein
MDISEGCERVNDILSSMDEEFIFLDADDIETWDVMAVRLASMARLFFRVGARMAAYSGVARKKANAEKGRDIKDSVSV